MKEREQPLDNLEQQENWKIQCYASNPQFGTTKFHLDDGLFANNDTRPIREQLKYFSNNLGVISIPQISLVTRVNLNSVEIPDLDVFDRMQTTNREAYDIEWDEDDEFADKPVTIVDRVREANWFDWNLPKWITYLVHTEYKRVSLKDEYQPHKYEDLLIRFAKQRLLHPTADWVGKRGAAAQMLDLWHSRWNYGEEPEKGELIYLEKEWGENKNKVYAFVGTGPFFATVQSKTSHPVSEMLPTAEDIEKANEKAFAIRNVVLGILQQEEIENILALSGETVQHRLNLINALQTPWEEVISSHQHEHHGKHDEYNGYSFPMPEDPYVLAHSWTHLQWRKNEPIYFNYFFSPNVNGYTIENLDYNDLEYARTLHEVGRTSPIYFPERKMLYQFVLSQQQLSHEWFLEHGAFQEIKYILNKGLISWRGVRVHHMHLDAEGLIKSLERRNSKLEGKLRREKELEIYGLRMHGSKHFGIANLGTCLIGDEEYFIYTGIEKLE